MTARRISVDEARGFFAHPSQWKSARPDELPADGVEYWASGPICGVFRDFSWPRVLDAHCGVKPEGWGQVVPHAREILRAVWDHHQPDLIVALTPSWNRATLAFNRRTGFTVIGTLPVEKGVVMQYWRPKCP